MDKKGRLVLIDFGLCARVDNIDMKGMTSAVVHLMRGDVEGLLDAIVLGFCQKMWIDRPCSPSCRKYTMKRNSQRRQISFIISAVRRGEKDL